METPNDEEDIEKRFSEVDGDGGDGEDHVDSAVLFSGNKSRAARQLQTVAKSFGSIGEHQTLENVHFILSTYRNLNFLLQSIF